MSELVLLVSGAGAILLINGISFRLATPMWRNWAKKYVLGDLTPVQRRGPLVNVPLGIAILLFSLAVTVSSLPWTGVLWALGAVCVALAAAFLLHPPSWAIPAWMRTGDVETFRQKPPMWRSDSAIWLLASAVATAVMVVLLIVDHNNVDRVIWVLALGIGGAVAAGARAKRRSASRHHSDR